MDSAHSRGNHVYWYIAAVLLVTWSITFIAFSDPSRNGLYAAIMLVPALVSLPFARMEGESRFSLFRIMPSGKSLLFALLYPLLVTAACAGIALAFGWATYTPDNFAAFLSGSVLPCMLFHFVWNVVNPPVLGNLYRNLPGVVSGNILALNGEGLLGVVVGLLFLPWFVRQFKALGTKQNVSTAA